MMRAWTWLRSRIVLEALKRGNSAEDEGSKTEEKSIGDDRVGENGSAFSMSFGTT